MQTSWYSFNSRYKWIYIHQILIKKVAENADLFLYDLKLMNDDLHQKYTGVSNQINLEKPY